MFLLSRKNKADICDAIRPVLPFLEKLDKYFSYDKVTAVYRGGGGGMLHVKETDLQEALQYVSLLSLLRYNQVLRKYWKYYYGVTPLMSSPEAAGRIYINMYWQHKGDKAEIDKVIAQFREELMISSENQVKRMNLVSRNDVFINAFVKTQVVSEFLSMDIESAIDKSVSDFEQSYTHRFE